MVSCLNSSNVRLMTAVVDVVGPNGKRRTVRAFIDQGAQASFVTADLVRSVVAPKVKEVSLAIQGFSTAIENTSTSVHEMHVIDCAGTHHPLNMIKRKNLNLDIPVVSTELRQRWRKRGVEVSDTAGRCSSEDIQMLIGADYANQFLQEKKEVEGEVAWRTNFGWVLSGTVRSETSPQSSRAATGKVNVHYVSNREVETLWEMEAPMKSEEIPLLPMTVEKGRYQVGLLWKGEERPDDNRNQALAVARHNLKRKLQDGTEDRKCYDEVLLAEYSQLDAIEEEPEPDSPGYYMPHHAVFRKDASTTKTRVVFNASASQVGQKSLNDVLDQGPSPLPSLIGLLLRFRTKKIALQADIKKAFFTIAVNEEDRKYLRFVWPNEEGLMTTYRLTRLPFGANCSPFIMTAVLRQHLNSAASNSDEKKKELIELMGDSFYVDDCISSVESEEEAARFKQVGVSTLESAGMELRKWRSNGEINDPTQPVDGKVLGTTWQSQKDTISFPVKAESPRNWTKRTLLKSVATLFDPLGLIAPYVIVGKIMIQELWKKGLEWDEPIDESLEREVAQWWGEVQELESLLFPRFVGPTSSPVTVHMFADASEKAYGCAIYLVTKGDTFLIYAKAKVAPLKSESLARLELQAAFLGSRSLQLVLAESRLVPSEVHAWTDSMTVRHWINQPSYRWKTFVANRVSEIQQISKDESVVWHHCPGQDNPADIVSRGATVKELKDRMWLHGPQWLTRTDLWPVERLTSTGTVEEVRVQAVLATPDEQKWWTRLSRWTRVVGMVARILSWKYRHEMKRKIRQRAEQIIFKIIQRECFPQELTSLMANQRVQRLQTATIPTVRG